MNQNIFTGRLNPDTGNPEIIYTDKDGNDKVVAEGSYHGFAFYDNGNGSKYIVFSSYFEGALPSNFIGSVLKLTRTPDDRKRMAEEGIRKAVDDTFMPLIIEKKVSLSTYGDICVALGYLGKEDTK